MEVEVEEEEEKEEMVSGNCDQDDEEQMNQGGLTEREEVDDNRKQEVDTEEEEVEVEVMVGDHLPTEVLGLTSQLKQTMSLGGGGGDNGQGDEDNQSRRDIHMDQNVTRNDESGVTMNGGGGGGLLVELTPSAVASERKRSKGDRSADVMKDKHRMTQTGGLFGAQGE